MFASTMDANLIAAQKVDSRIVEILGSAPSTAIYGYSDAKKCWEKSEHEGALLICRSSGQPQHCFIILNQLKPQNFIQYLDGGISLQRKHEYLLYKAPSADAVRAIWFYNEQDCVRLYGVVKDAVENAKVAEHKKPPPSSAEASGSSRSSVKASQSQDAKMGKDILSMLSSAAHQKVDSLAVRQSKDSGGPVQVLQSGPVGGGGDARPSQMSSSIPLESLFKSVGPGRNGASDVVSHRQGNTDDGQGRGKEQLLTEPVTSMAGVNAYPFTSIGKGRGRALTNDAAAEMSVSSAITPTAQLSPSVTSMAPMVPMLQRLFTGPGNAAGDQHQPTVSSSAFTSVAPRQSQGIGPNGGNAPVVVSLMSNMRLESPMGPGGEASRPLLGSQFSPIGAGMNMDRDMGQLLTPADLGAAIHGSDNGSFNQAFSSGLPAMPTGQSQLQGISPPSTNSTAGQCAMYPPFMIEQFRQSFIHLLEHNNDFVQRMYDAFVQESARRNGPGYGTGEGWRKN